MTETDAETKQVNTVIFRRRMVDRRTLTDQIRKRIGACNSHVAQTILVHNSSTSMADCTKHLLYLSTD